MIYFLVRSEHHGRNAGRGIVITGSESEANECARNSANKHGKPFSVFKVVETQHGTYGPGDTEVMGAAYDRRSMSTESFRQTFKELVVSYCDVGKTEAVKRINQVKSLLTTHANGAKRLSEVEPEHEEAVLIAFQVLIANGPQA